MAEDFAPPAETRGTRSSCDELSRLRFAPLSRAQQEARDVAGIFAKGNGSTTAVLAGAQATEARLKREAAGRQVLHLATHGFFLGAGCTPKPAPGADALAAPIATASAPWVLSENPLLLSGLALASANRRTEAPVNAEDGVLTAEEIAALDLTRTSWVVLSACDTGLGVEAAEEGVLGMRRALRVAGARSLILSLWRVDDAATRRFMEQLYRERFERHADTAAAVHAASLAALQQARAAGSGHPFQWAAFLAVGDWR
jgi:CHAT domain-containing protein